MAVPQKVCTECGENLLDKHGQEVTELFDEHLRIKSKIIKLVECQCCQAVADKYVEREGVLILIDLLLQYPEAYRHILFNGDYIKLIIKMTILTIICDGYIRWSLSPAPGEFFEQEFHFYMECLNVTMGLFVFIAICLFTCSGSSIEPCAKGLFMAYSMRFANITSFLWAIRPDDAEVEDVNEPSELMWTFVYMMFFSATVRTIQVTQRRSLLSSIVLSLLCHFGFFATINHDSVLWPYTCGR